MQRPSETLPPAQNQNRHQRRLIGWAAFETATLRSPHAVDLQRATLRAGEHLLLKRPVFNPDRKFTHWGKKRWRATNSLICVLARQQFVCSFYGTTVLIRALRSPMQVSQNRGGRAFSKASNFEPGRPPDIARRPIHGHQTGAPSPLLVRMHPKPRHGRSSRVR
jgi:hypothetical protein